MSARTKWTVASAGLAGLVTAVTLGAVASGANPGVDPALPPEKQAIEASIRAADRKREADARDPKKVQAILDHKRAAAARPGELTTDTQAWPEGIFEDAEAPASGSFFRGRNRWVGRVDGRSVAVHAGVSGEDPSVGRLLGEIAGGQGQTERGFAVDLPGAGPLRVTAASGTVLTVVDEHGKRHLFDVRTQQFTG